jgi:PKD repeat protein
VDLEEADGLNHLDSYGSNRGDAFDPWYNKIVGFTATSTPNSPLYNGSDSGFRVTNIGASGTVMVAHLIVSGGPGPDVASITPAIGENTGSVSITNLGGSNFVTGATVRLISSDNSNINATGVTVVSPTKITCTLPLSGKPSGQYNIFVINPDGQAGVLANGFTVTAPTVPKITSITPATGVNTSSVSITNLAGTNFAVGATVKLNRTGYADIPGTSVTVVSPTQITCTFDLTNRIAGVYNVVVINPGNQVLVLANGFSVTVIPAPVADFTANVTAGTAPLTVQFTDTSTGSPDYWSWYSDRHGFNTNDPESRDWIHTYQNTGTYTVDLTVTNDAGSDTESKIGFIVVFSLNPLPGISNPPTDPDSDGLYEDLNANNRKDFNDVVLMFNQMQWIAANEPVSAFDFNGNGRIDFNDIVKLFGEI